MFLFPVNKLGRQFEANPRQRFLVAQESEMGWGGQDLSHKTLALMLAAPFRSADPSTWEFFSIPLFTRTTCLAIAGHLQSPIEVDPRCWVFPVIGENR